MAHDLDLKKLLDDFVEGELVRMKSSDTPIMIVEQFCGGRAVSVVWMDVHHVLHRDALHPLALLKVECSPKG